jgi:hypothetical protein
LCGVALDVLERLLDDGHESTASVQLRTMMRRRHSRNPAQAVIDVGNPEALLSSHRRPPELGERRLIQAEPEPL